MTRFHALRAWLSARPARPTRTALTVQALESRDVPASWFSVHLDSPAEGVPGSSARTVDGGGLAVRAHYDADGDGTATVLAEYAEEAVRLALGGAVSVAGENFALTPATSSEYTDELKPFGVGATPGGVTVWLEDLANDPACDWDYNDTSWAVRVTDALPQPSALWIERTEFDSPFAPPLTQSLTRGTAEAVPIVLSRSGDLSTALTVNLGVNSNAVYGRGGDFILTVDGVALLTPQVTMPAGTGRITMELRWPAGGRPGGSDEVVTLCPQVPGYLAQPARMYGLLVPPAPVVPPATPAPDPKKLPYELTEDQIKKHILAIESIVLRQKLPTKVSIQITGGHHKDAIPTGKADADLRDNNKPIVQVKIDLNPEYSQKDPVKRKTEPYKVEYKPVGPKGETVVGEGQPKEDVALRTKTFFPDDTTAAEIKALGEQAFNQARNAAASDPDNVFKINPSGTDGTFQGLRTMNP